MQNNKFNIEEEIKKLPSKPGVYLMHDKNNNIIYVGKAISLKRRVLPERPGLNLRAHQ